MDLGGSHSAASVPELTDEDIAQALDFAASNLDDQLSPQDVMRSGCNSSRR